MIERILEISTFSTFLRTAIFTVGHFTIDVFVIGYITQASIERVTLAATIGPLINGCWFFILDRAWSYLHSKDEKQHTTIVNSSQKS